jgi:hypothetical protein
VLTPEYIYDSLENGWKDEREYTKGGCDLVKSSLFWIDYFKKSKKKAFQDWKVYLNVSKAKAPGFRRLFEAGRAEVLDSDEGFVNCNDFYYFVDKTTVVAAKKVSIVNKDIWRSKNG